MIAMVGIFEQSRLAQFAFRLTLHAESYIRGGLTQGLRPEYAIFCGLHESEPRWRESYARHFYTKSYQEHADSIVRGNLAVYGILWDQRLELDPDVLVGDKKKGKVEDESVEL